mgnify:CR=1 FL=1
MQNSVQRSSGKFSYINYDASDRVTETGEYDPVLPGNPEILTPYFFFETSEVYNPNLSYPGKSSIGGIVEQNGSFDVYRCTQQTYFDYDGGNTDIPVSVGAHCRRAFKQIMECRSGYLVQLRRAGSPVMDRDVGRWQCGG